MSGRRFANNTKFGLGSIIEKNARSTCDAPAFTPSGASCLQLTRIEPDTQRVQGIRPRKGAIRAWKSSHLHLPRPDLFIPVAYYLGGWLTADVVVARESSTNFIFVVSRRLCQSCIVAGNYNNRGCAAEISLASNSSAFLGAAGSATKFLNVCCRHSLLWTSLFMPP